MIKTSNKFLDVLLQRLRDIRWSKLRLGSLYCGVWCLCVGIHLCLGCPSPALLSSASLCRKHCPSSLSVISCHIKIGYEAFFLPYQPESTGHSTLGEVVSKSIWQMNVTYDPSNSPVSSQQRNLHLQTLWKMVTRALETVLYCLS